MTDGICEYIYADGEKCDIESDVLDKNGKNYCQEHYQYIRDGEKAQKKPRKKRYTKGL